MIAEVGKPPHAEIIPGDVSAKSLFSGDDRGGGRGTGNAMISDIGQTKILPLMALMALISADPGEF